ncbi:MAG TPA: glycerophosphodiester phosphodiesterase family protein [Thermomicrobiales bacterium]|nr:glycerophosphodiester phosphodiesterase family protein [Thermomicrobiales bacterium]
MIRYARQPDRGRTPPLVIAHRGASLAAPENTLPAFELAIAAGASMIETDAQITADDQVVLVHDADLRRTTGRAGRIGSMDAARVRSYDAGFTFKLPGDESFAYRGRGVVVPTLGELIDLLDAHPAILLNLELKTQDAGHRSRRTRDLAGAAVTELRDRGMLDRTLVSSFAPEALKWARATEPEVATALLVNRYTDFDGVCAIAAAAGYAAIHPNDVYFGDGEAARRSVDAAHRRGLRVNVWTVDDEERMRALIDAGVNGIITNDPARLRQMIVGARLRS